MTEGRVQRRLTTILAADVVGYSRLMELDEAGTMAQLRARRHDVVMPAVARQGGRIFKVMGDGVLIEFTSVVNAVECAIELQKAMQAQNTGLPVHQHILLRIGINLGDVIVEGSDLYGDGVNLAARLESLAEPGGICVSGDVYRQVRSKLQMQFQDMGEQKVKNIVGPVHAYRVQAEDAAPASAESPEIHRSASTLPNKPSIAVLPFTNMSNDPDQDYFADGMVEDIITALSRFNQLFVIARNSSFTYKGRAVDVRQVARELGVRFVLEGSVRRAGSRVRITGQLIDAATGAHLWADRFDGDLEDVFELQDKITGSVVGAIEPTLRKAEIERARRRPVENLDAYDLYLRALPHVYAFRPDENLMGLKLLQKAIDLEPTYALALAFAAWCHEQRLVRGWPPVGQDDAGTAIALARRAISAGSDDAMALAAAGFVLVMVARDYDAGLDAVRRASELNPGSGFVEFLSSTALLFGGDPEGALIRAERAMVLSPMDPGAFMFLAIAGIAHLYAGRPEQALELGKRSAALNPNWDSAYWLLIPAYVQLDRMEDARAALAKLVALSPGLTVSGARQRLPIRNPASLEMVLEGFRKAGLPE
ncbi:adenylate cyclase [Hypericibacter terrae]|uniref:Adenylate cyclase n=1 Tax=Hypericibacter terrae TaxID=2602015 RepID=A0A5J6MMB2_9PROT|nr:adenylate/guanylate cyclase domain-containing protein [Hypericibacter terrae]QEX17665.1 adenylate cyclase [Hypericibacter terrae]